MRMQQQIRGSANSSVRSVSLRQNEGWSSPEDVYPICGGGGGEKRESVSQIKRRHPAQLAVSEPSKKKKQKTCSLSAIFATTLSNQKLKEMHNVWTGKTDAKQPTILAALDKAKKNGKPKITRLDSDSDDDAKIIQGQLVFDSQFRVLGEGKWKTFS